METEQWVFMVVLVISSLLNVAYLLPIPIRAFFPGNEALPTNGNLSGKSTIKEAPLPSLIALSITTLACLVLFIYPQPLYELAASILETSGVAYGK
jgi:multicomponent Na+:H+ antiporter subunit D